MIAAFGLPTEPEPGMFSIVGMAVADVHLTRLLPDGSGVLRCLMPNPDGGVTCQPNGQVCTSNGDCCAGLTCVIAAGAISGLCRVPAPPTGSDAGVPICATTGQGCTVQSDCCAGLTCNSAGGSGAPCAAGEAGCTCYVVVR
jgi:hypothetical protein